MSTVLLLIENEANRNLLSEWQWLSHNHEILVVEPGEEIDDEFDLCIVDLPSMEEFHDSLRAYKDDPSRAFTPRLLVSPRDPSEFSNSDLWQFIDEVITTPIRKRELRGRINVLLRTRELTMELKRSEERFRTLFQAGPDPAFVLDGGESIDDANDAFCDLVDMAFDDVVGRSFPDLDCFAEDTVETLVNQVNTDGGTVESRSRYTITLDTDNTRVFDVNTARIRSGEDDEGLIGIMRDITEREQREDELAALNEMVQEFTQARTPEEVCDVVIEASVSSLNLPLTVIALYDDDDGVLEPVARTERAAEIGDELLFDREVDIAWRTYVENEAQIHDDLHDIDGFDDTALRSAIILPLGKHGVLVTGSLTPNAFDDADLDFAELLAANTEATLDRAEREKLLHERERTFQEQNEMLTRLNRINDVIRGIDQALVGASTREEIERAVCQRLIESEPYVLAWIGEYDATNNRVEPSHWAGKNDGYLDEVTFRSGDEEAGPVGRALQRGDTEVVDDMHGTPPFPAWREAALKWGYRSSITIPLVYSNSLYGVMTVYADEASVFTGREREIMEELGNTIAYAINAVQSKLALISDSVVELEFQIRDSDFFLSRLARETGCEVSLKGYLPQSEDSSVLFFTVSGTSPDDVLDFADRSVSVSHASLISESEDGEESLFEFRMSGQNIASMLADHGAVPRTITSQGEVTNIVTELSHGSDIRAFVEMFQNQFPETELLARRERERPLQTQQAFRSELLDTLTDRQQEVLRAAYFSGFFDWPRRNSGTEIAEALDISQPTFHNHLRTSERKLFEMLLDDE